MMLLDESRLDIAFNECIVACERSEKLDVGRNADHFIFFQSSPEHSQGLGPVPSMDHKLGDHRVVENADLSTFSEALLKSE